jgi:hypothetical protein
VIDWFFITIEGSWASAEQRNAAVQLRVQTHTSHRHCLSLLNHSAYSSHPPLIMSGPPPHPISPPPGVVGTEQQSATVRRHHTITGPSRSARTAARVPISEESQEQQTWDDPEVVDQERVRSVGAVGEKSSLHRQASLPARYNRGTSFVICCPSKRCHTSVPDNITHKVMAMRRALRVILPLAH